MAILKLFNLAKGNVYGWGWATADYQNANPRILVFCTEQTCFCVISFMSNIRLFTFTQSHMATPDSFGPCYIVIGIVQSYLI